MNKKELQGMSSLILRLTLVVVLLSSVLAFFQSVGVSAGSTPIVVNSLADAVNTDGACTLREAIIAANKDQASSPGAGECPAGGGADTIILPAGTYVLTRNSSGNNSAASGDLDVASTITISPTGPVTITTASGFNDRILVIDPGAHLTLANVTLMGGNAGGDGGGLYNAGALVLKNSAIVTNTASGRGGGLYNSGTATLSNVTLSGNAARTHGGGILNLGTLTMNNVTLAGNTADVNDTETGNGGGIAVIGGEVYLKNTLIANNADNSATTKHLDCSGALYSQGYNLIQDTADCALTGTLTGNITGQDPRLGPLQYNGGNSPTRALLSGSPAIDAGSPATFGSGDSACEATDQRGASRPRGMACDIGAYEAGQPNFPVVIRAISLGASGAAIDGRLASAGNTTFTLRFYASPSCDAASLLANPLPGVYPVTTTSTGNVYFHTSVSVSIPDGQFVAATATDVNGETSALSACVAAGPGNDSWPRALHLTLAGSTPSASVEHYLDKAGQSRWYKLSVQPNEQVIVTLTRLPANYDLTVYKDITAVFTDVNSIQDLVRLGAEFAPDAFSPDAFSPDAFSPDAFSPDAFSPDAFSPDAFSPDAYSPDAFSPDAFSPDAYSPDAFSPDAFSPDAYSPDAFSPDAYSPDAYSPDAYSPDAYSSAQSRSLIAVSAFEGTASEGIVINTWGNTGDVYVRARGRNGAFNVQAPFHLQVIRVPGNCSVITTSFPVSSSVPMAANAKTIIVADWGRMPDSPADKTALQNKLAAFAARPEVAGVIVDVGADARVAAANVQADANLACPTAKNIVAGAIKDIVTRYRALNPLEYIVIVGSDDVVPFFRYPDSALLANEKNYAPPVRDSTASQASLKLGYVLSQDAYGSQVDVSSKANTFPIPNLAVGRLVETTDEISTTLDAYLGTNGGVVPTPTSALVTGYDFLADAASAVQAQLEAGLGRSADVLITPEAISPSDPRSWTADQLRTQLLGNRHDLIFLAGHFSANGALAADYRTRLQSTDVVNSSVNLTNTLIFSAGCHAGYNIVNSDDVPGVTLQPDWAQAFARKGATLVAGTGYQYGDTDFIEYGERLYLEFSKQLRTGAGPVAIGKALVAAKQAYLADTPQMRGIHEKSLLEATLFGLPMLSINLPGARITPVADAPIVNSVTPFTSSPGSGLGLQFADVTLAPTLTANLVPLNVISSTAVVTATYLSGSSGIVATPAEPVLPKEVRNVSVPNLVLRGVGFRGGAYTDAPNVLPLLGAATTEIRGVHAAFSSNYFYPIQPWSINYFDALANPSGGATRLTVLPAQFKPDTSVTPTGTLRQFNNMNFRLYYSNNTATFGGGSVPALAAPPTIARVSGSIGSGSVSFHIHVVGNPAAGIQQAWVTYSAVNGDLAGQWQSLDLAQSATDSTLWAGTLDLGSTAPQDVRYIVQAVNGVGLVSVATNLGAYYVPGVDTLPTVSTTLTVETPTSSGAYGTRASLSAVLTSNGTPLPSQAVSFALGPARRQAMTDANGRTTVVLPLLAPPDTYEVRAAFNGTAEYLAASASGAFTITSQNTVMSLAPQSLTTLYTNQVRLTTTLKATTGRLLANKAVFFIVSGNGKSFALAASTGPDGQAFVDVGPLAAGTHAVHAYFSGNIPLPNQPITLTDDSYSPATAAGTLIFVNSPGTTITDTPANPSNSSAATFSFTGSPDPAVAALGATFQCQFDGGAFESCASPKTYTSLSDGSHTFNVRAVDSLGNLDPTPASLSWVVDTVAPDTNVTPGPANPTNSSSASFGFTGTDSGTGIAHLECQLDGGTFATCASPVTYTNLADSSHTFAVRAVDNAGNVDATPALFTWLVDTAPPTIACGSADGLWHKDNVSIACTASDGGAGLANSVDVSFTLGTNVPAGSEISDASTNTRIVCDVLGNCATAGPITGNKVDRRLPSVTITSPAAMAYTLNQSVVASYSCADGGSGVATCVGTVANGSLLNTSLVGVRTFTVTATDLVGNSSTLTVTYRVAFAFTGFFSPVSNPPYINTVNAGRAIPVKFSLGGNQGLNIFAAGYPTVQPIACNPSAPTNIVKQTTNDTTSYLSFNAGANQYIYVWKTDSSWAGTCRQLTLQFIDGTTQIAYFKFN